MPIYFGFPKQEKYNINIETPGYKVESLPESVKVLYGRRNRFFSINILSGNKIQIVTRARQLFQLIIMMY
jgi:hypothetical protein